MFMNRRRYFALTEQFQYKFTKSTGLFSIILKKSSSLFNIFVTKHSYVAKIHQNFFHNLSQFFPLCWLWLTLVPV